MNMQVSDNVNRAGIVSSVPNTSVGSGGTAGMVGGWVNVYGAPQRCPNCGACPHCGKYVAPPPAVVPSYPTWPPYTPYIGDPPGGLGGTTVCGTGGGQQNKG